MQSRFGAKTEKPKKDLGVVIGIDLEIIENDQGNRITPSCVGFTPDGKRLIGDGAKNLLTSNPENTIFQIKRLMGRKYNDSSVQKDIKNFPFSVQESRGKPVVQVKTRYGDKLFTPEEISAMILGKMREIAEAYLKEPVRNAVVTVPAYFNDAQRQATKDAGTIAGLNVVRIINEPTAAAIAYGLNKLSAKEKEKNILVYDLGGGTFDVSVLTLDNGAFQVLATNGDTHLGGEDFDQRIVNHFIDLFKKRTGIDVRKNARALEKLRREAEKAKRMLSVEHETKVEVESLMSGVDFSEKLSRAKFEELNSDLFRATMVPIQRVLEDAKLKKSNIDEVLLVGGSTRIPKVRQILKAYFNGLEPARSINPDEAVAHGAAIQAGILSREKCADEIVVIDVNPLTLGIEVKGGIMSSIIRRNSEIPVTTTENFVTTEDDQTVVAVRIFEGERAKAAENHFLGAFDLTGIPPAPRGVAKIEVTFDIDVNGILTVTAKETTSGNKKALVINAKTNRLTAQEIDRMIKISELFEEEDKLVRRWATAKSDLESYVYSLRNQLKNPTSAFDDLSAKGKAILADEIEKQIKWLDANPEAKTQEFQERKKRLEQAVIRTMTDHQSESIHVNYTRTDL